MNKRAQKIAGGKIGHSVLLFGEDVFGNDSSVIRPHENAEIDVVPLQEYSKLKRLTDYTLVILDYSPFNSLRGIPTDKQNVFDKMIMEALDGGTTFCFVHYNEKVPDYDKYSSATGHMNKEHIVKCIDAQLGFRWLNNFSIRPHHAPQPFVIGSVKRGEFRPFISKWGASHNYFSTYGEYELDDIIYQIQQYPLAFSINFSAGRIIMMPFQRDFDRSHDLSDAIYTLVDCILTYITKSLTELPEWARVPFFDGEKALYDECTVLEERLEERRKALEPFTTAKAIMCQAEYTLERTVPSFFSQHLGLRTQRSEQFKEDFWILNDSGERVILGEVKSYVKGFKRSGVFSVYNHREANKLPHTFPCVLLVNSNMQSGSWEKKDRPINKQDYEIAAQNNVLIVRTEDLVRMWDALQSEKITSANVFAALSHMTGWLEVQSNGVMTEHK